MSSYRRKSSLFSLLDDRGDASQDNQYWSWRELFSMSARADSKIMRRLAEVDEWLERFRFGYSRKNRNRWMRKKRIWLRSWKNKFGRLRLDYDKQEEGSHGFFAEQARYTKTIVASRDILISAWKNISRINSAVSSDSDTLRNRDERRTIKVILRDKSEQERCVIYVSEKGVM